VRHPTSPKKGFKRNCFACWFEFRRRAFVFVFVFVSSDCPCSTAAGIMCATIVWSSVTFIVTTAGWKLAKLSSKRKEKVKEEERITRKILSTKTNK